VLGIHNARGEPVAGTEQDTAGDAEGDRSDGRHRPSQVHNNRAAAEAEHLRSSHDSAIQISRRSV